MNFNQLLSWEYAFYLLASVVIIWVVLVQVFKKDLSFRPKGVRLFLLVVFTAILIAVYLFLNNIAIFVSSIVLPIIWTYIDEYYTKLKSDKVILIPKTNTGYSKYLIEKIEKKIKDKNSKLEVEIIWPKENRDENVDMILANFNKAVSKNPDAIVITPPPTKEKLYRPVINAIDSKIPVITIDDNFDTEYFLEKEVKPPINIRLDYAEGGSLAGVLLKEKLDKKGSVAIISGPEDSLSSRIRKNAFINEILKEAPNMRIVAIRETNWGQEDAKAQMRSMLALNIKIDAVFCCNDRLAIGALEVLSEKKNKDSSFHSPVILGHDGIKEVYRFIREQLIYASVDQNIDVQAEYGAQEVLKACLNKNLYLNKHKTKVVIKPSKLTYEVIKEKELTK